ncbi:hypothetical protein SASPL_148808 [Salvia splendens]|uniref:Uncharacterized protein n=1 Tax=Salvia splendens TaxID=180675 RepID=A0A8X8WAF2_SALSN|nr:hypothetical protein SASPL_148808 [Salvia splendens]
MFPLVGGRAVNCNTRGGNPSGCVDGLWWYKDIAQHIHGEFSMARGYPSKQCVGRSMPSKVGPLSSMEAGPRGTFVGIYDVHAGPEASRVVRMFVVVLFDMIYVRESRNVCGCYKESVREEWRSLQPEDPNIVVLKHMVWRVKGLIQGVAKKLVKAALQEAALKREVRYSDLERIDRGVRRHFHDDITVIVHHFP